MRVPSPSPNWTWAQMGPGPKWVMGPNVPLAQMDPGPKQTLGRNGPCAQTGQMGPNEPWAQMGQIILHGQDDAEAHQHDFPSGGPCHGCHWWLRGQLGRAEKQDK